jgi:AraC-like DNA-binding protein
MSELISLKSISEAHQLIGLEKPKHPLISVFQNIPEMHTDFKEVRITGDLYFFSLKEGISGALGYGRNSYDFEEGTMTFIAPGQVISGGDTEPVSEDRGWSVLFHPDLIRRTELGRKIDSYTFFDYEVNEALHLSDREKQTLTDLAYKIEEEINLNTDKHTQALIVSNLELILNYCTRYYDRQFYTRTSINKDIVASFEAFLKQYFKEEKQLDLGLPTVKYCSEQLNFSAPYLSDLLKKETGRNAQDHIHSYIVDRAKTILLNSTGSISQVAYSLGFEYSQHFSKVFKARTGMSPKEYRSLN